MDNKMICKYCNTECTKKNWARHRQSKICQSYQKSVKAFNNMLLEKDIKIKTLDDLVRKPFTDQKGKIIYLNNFQLRFLNKIN